jgi:hypothetical protein
VPKPAREKTHARVHDWNVFFGEEAALLELWNEAIHFSGAEEEIDLRQRIDQFVFVALYHATDADDSFAPPFVLEAARLDECVDGFFFGGVDEPAGVDDDDIGVGHIGRILGAAVGQLGDIALAVDGVFVAPEGDHGDFQHG